MKKKLIARCLVGIPVGITIGYVITIIISAIWGNGQYLAVRPELVAFAGTQVKAVVLQLVLLAILGAGCGGASVVWDMENWSLARQSGVYFGVLCAVMLPIAYVAHWMEHTVRGVLSYVGIFVGIFAIVWLSQYIFWSIKIRRMNENMKP